MNELISRIHRRDVMFLLGAGGFVHEVIVAQGERPVVIAACCALMGLKYFLKGEEKLRDGREDRDQ